MLYITLMLTDCRLSGRKTVFKIRQFCFIHYIIMLMCQPSGNAIQSCVCVVCVCVCVIFDFHFSVLQHQGKGHFLSLVG